MLDTAFEHPKWLVCCSLLGGYVLASSYLSRHPSLLHKKKKTFFVRNISHRGGAAECYENTMTAFKQAIASGSEMLEVDCQITRDQKVVVAHDNNLKRLCGVDECISSLNFDQLPAVKNELPIDFEPGSFFAIRDGAERPNQNIQLLEDLFKHFPQYPINIDVKSDDDFLIREVARLIRQYDRQEITVWGSILSNVTDKCYKEDPTLPLFFSKKRVGMLMLLYYTGLLPFVPLRETHLEILAPFMYKRWETAGKKPPFPWIIRKIANYLLMNKSLFLHLEKRGIPTYLWVLNTEEEYAQAFKLGATAVITDYPSRLNEFLLKNAHAINVAQRESTQSEKANANPSESCEILSN